MFGSVARGEGTEGSDVDLLVDLNDGVGLVSLSALTRASPRSLVSTLMWCRLTL